MEEIGAGEKPNITWPENSVGGCTATQLSPIKRSNEPPNNLVPPLGTGGGDLVKKVIRIPLVKGRSSSNIISKIVKAYGR